MLDNDGCGPIPLVNSHTNEENCEYTHIQVELTCPAQLPPEMNGRGAAFRVIDLEGAPLLPAAVRLGTFLYLYQIKAILSSLEGVPPLEKGSGSGKNGAFVKLDYAVQLVKFLFGDCDVEDQMHMVRKMCYPSSQKVAEKEQVILDYLACLDVENQEAFKEMKGLAQEEIQKWDEDNIRAKLGLPSEKKTRMKMQNGKILVWECKSQKGKGQPLVQSQKLTLAREVQNGLRSHPRNSMSSSLRNLERT